MVIIDTYFAILKINKNLIVTSAPQYPLTGRCHLVDVRSGTQLTTSTTLKKSFLIIFYSQHVGEVLVSLCQAATKDTNISSVLILKLKCYPRKDVP